MFKSWRFLTLFCLVLGAQSLLAKLSDPIGKSVTETVSELEGIGIDQKIGSTLPDNIEFKDENGKTVKINQYLSPGKPIILSPVYYGCGSLCNFHLNGLTEGLKGLPWNAGEKFEVVALSFDSREEPPLANTKKASYMKLYDRPEFTQGWHFLTGSVESIKVIMMALGFKYRWNDKQNEWSHASSAVVISPEGKITRYLPGVFFRPQDIKLALNESVDGKLGTFVDRMVLFCFRYDEHQSKYSPFVSNIMKLGGGLMILMLLVWLVPFWLKSRRQKFT